MKAIVLAAGCGNRLHGVFDDPKCLIPVGGIPLLGRYLEGFGAIGIDEVVLVLGYGMKKVVNYIKTLCAGFPVRILMNRDFEKGSILSLWTAKRWLAGDILLMDGDVYFENEVLLKAAAAYRSDFFLLDSGARNDGEAVMVGFKGQKAVALARGLKGDFDVMGEWAGMIRLSKEGASLLREVVCREVAAGNINEGYEFVIPQLFDKFDISYQLIDGLKWVEIDYPDDIARARNMAVAEKAIRS